MAESALQAGIVAPLAGAAATTIAWRFQGQLHVTVIAKATFAFTPDADMPRVEPQPILKAEIHHGNNPARSVRFTSDLAPYLGQADVLFTGHASSPEGRAVRSLPLRLALFDGNQFVLDKRLVAQDASGFQRMPLVYERALSGADGHENPLGITMNAGEPNVVDPAAPERPAGFGPIARAWPARKRLLGSTPRKALEGAVAEIPDAFEWSYFQAAPLDQRVDFLSGDEWILLEGLHPALESLRTRLPGARGLAQIHGLSAFGMQEGHPLDLHIDTLRIDGDEERCTIVGRRSFPVASEAALATMWIAAGIEIGGETIAWPAQLPASLATAAREPARTHGAMGTVRIEETPSVQLANAAPQASDAGATMTLDDDAVEVVDEPVLETMVLSPEAVEPASRKPVVPFRSARDAAPQAESAPPTSSPAATLALLPDDAASASMRPSLPFSESFRASAESRLPTSAPLPGAPWSRESAPPVPAPSGEPATLMLGGDAADALLRRVMPQASPEPSVGGRPLPPDEKPPEASRFFHELRRMQPPPEDAAASADRPAPSAPLNDGETVSLERVAAITAELSERPVPRADVLAAHGLSEAAFGSAQHRWDEALDEEQKRGVRALRDRFDAAYVASWEALRGPLEVAAYARLVVAEESGSLSSTLDALAIRRTVWTRIKRLWSKRLADSPSLKAHVNREVAKLRR